MAGKCVVKAPDAIALDSDRYSARFGIDLSILSIQCRPLCLFSDVVGLLNYHRLGNGWPFSILISVCFQIFRSAGLDAVRVSTFNIGRNSRWRGHVEIALTKLYIFSVERVVVAQVCGLLSCKIPQVPRSRIHF